MQSKLRNTSTLNDYRKGKEGKANKGNCYSLFKICECKKINKKKKNLKINTQITRRQAFAQLNKACLGLLNFK